MIIRFISASHFISSLLVAIFGSTFVILWSGGIMDSWTIISFVLVSLFLINRALNAIIITKDKFIYIRNWFCIPIVDTQRLSKISKIEIIEYDKSAEDKIEDDMKIEFSESVQAQNLYTIKPNSNKSLNISNENIYFLKFYEENKDFVIPIYLFNDQESLVHSVINRYLQTQ